MYIICKSEERKKREADILRTYNYSERSSAEVREYAEVAAEKINKALKILEKKQR